MSYTSVQRKILGGQNYLVSDHDMVMSESECCILDSVIEKWLQHAPNENTHIMNALKVPSMFVRVDYTLYDGEVCIYEVDCSPHGMSIAGLTSQVLASNINCLVRDVLKPCKAYVSSSRVITDSHLTFGDASKVEGYMEGNGFLWPVMRPEELQNCPPEWNIQARSLRPIVTEGDKSYLEYVPEAHAKIVSSVKQCDLREAFFLKPVQGTRGFKACLWWPYQGQKPKDAINKEEKLKSKMAQSSTWVIQPYFPAIDLSQVQVHMKAIRRVFAVHIGGFKYHLLGGMWNGLDARKYSIIHGRDSAVFGAVILPQSRESQLRSVINAGRDLSLV